MSATLLAKCPGCKKSVRIPEEWASRTVRCKYCGLVCQAKPTAALTQRRTQGQEAQSAETAVPVSQPTANAGNTLIADFERFSPMAPIVAPQIVGPPTTSHDPFAALDAAPDGQSIVSSKSARRRRRRSLIPAVVGIVVFVAGIAAVGFGVTYALKNPERVRELANVTDQPGTSAGKQTKDGSTAEAEPEGKGSAPVAVQFPRRLLGISVNNYLFANPISYGTDLDKRTTAGNKHDFGNTLVRIAEKLKIPKTQFFELSDGAAGGNMRPPLKPIIEQTVTRFLETCRPQDRIILIFAGHSVEIDGKAYLVPLEGELDDAKTLIPLEWLMQQLEKCQAQQKLLIADLNRFDPARGFERPSGGKLSKAADTLLHNPPTGVQVWSACAAGQYSHEYDDYASFNGIDIKGGVFLNLFFEAFRKGLGGIQRPEDPLPIPALAQEVNELTKAMFARSETDANGKETTMLEQTPFVAGGQAKEESLPFDATAPPPASFTIPTPANIFDKGLADKDQVAALLDEIALPPIKQARATGTTVRFDSVVPFTAEAMKAYKADYGALKEIRDDAEKYPLRVATLKAIDKLRDLSKTSSIDLPEELRNSATDQFKATLKNLQKGPARIMDELKEVVEMLEKAGEDRKEEKSRRWQAHYDFVVAQAKLKLVATHQYSLMTGQVRRDALPELPKGKKGSWGWRLAANEALHPETNSEIKGYRTDARKLLEKLIKANPGTPWEVLAKREQKTALGLEWVPTNFGADVASMDGN